jgi:transposase
MNGKQTKRKFNQEFKDDAVKHLIESGKTTTEVAGELGVLCCNLRRWKKAYLSTLDSKVTGGSGKLKPSELEAENQRLRKELKRVQTQREILKKAVIFFGQENASSSGL